MVLNCDATGGLLNFPMVEEWKDKILHTKLAVNPKYPIVESEYTRDKQVSRILSPLTMAEMVSNKNTATDYRDFFSGFHASVREVFQNDTTERPLIIMTDCSVQLESGALLAFSSGEGMASTRIEYGNIVLLHLLYYDKVVSTVTSATSGVDVTESKKEAASHVLASLRMKIGIFLKECRSHVFRAPKHWMHTNHSSEFAGMKPRYEGMLMKVFDEATIEPKISVVIVQLSLVVAMLETEKFDSPSFYDTTEMKDCRGSLEVAAEERMLQNVNSFIRVESERLHIQSLEDVRARLDHSDVKRKYILLHEDIVKRAKTLMKGQCCAYLQSISVSNDAVNQMMGTVRCSITYGSSLRGDGAVMESWREGGLSLTVQLPHNGQEGIINSMYSPTVAAYLKRYWMGKFSLWCRGIVDVIETGMDMQIEANNQFSEGLIKNIKHNQGVYDHVSEPADYILHRYDDSDRSTKQFIHQYETVHGKIQELLSRRAKRQREGNLNAPLVVAAMPTEDELTQQAEEAETEPWKKRGRAPEFDNKLRSELVEVLHEDASLNNYSKKHKYIERYVGTSQISYPTFKNFMEDNVKSGSGLAPKHRLALQTFLDMKRQERVDSSTEPAASLPSSEDT